MRHAAVIVSLCALTLLGACGRIGVRRQHDPLGRGCSMGIEQAGKVEYVWGEIARVGDDWVVVSESDGTTIGIPRDRVVWMRVAPPR